MSSPTLWAVGRHTPLVRHKVVKGWAHVEDMDGELYWVRANEITNKVQCRMVRVGVANLRGGPGTQYPMDDFQSADRYTPFLVLKTQGAWVQVQDTYGGSYWIHSNNLWRPVKLTRISF